MALSVFWLNLTFYMSTSKPHQLFSLAAFLLSFLSMMSTAAAAEANGSKLDEIAKLIGDKSLEYVFFNIPGTELPFVLLLLVFSAAFLTIYFAFINVRGLKRSFHTVRGKYSKDTDPGEITHFQALSSALSATVGLGEYSRCSYSYNSWRSWSCFLDDSLRSSGYDYQIL